MTAFRLIFLAVLVQSTAKRSAYTVITAALPASIRTPFSLKSRNIFSLVRFSWELFGVSVSETTAELSVWGVNAPWLRNTFPDPKRQTRPHRPLRGRTFTSCTFSRHDRMSKLTLFVWLNENIRYGTGPQYNWNPMIRVNSCNSWSLIFSAISAFSARD